jgi:nucleoside phosphorylase
VAYQIKRKIKYLRDSHSNSTDPDYGCELCVLTALYDPEFKALQRLPWGWSRRLLPGDATHYWEGCFAREGEEHKVVAAYASKIGMTFAATLAMKMIYEFRPRYLAMIGIAAGIRGKCTLGDAIVADPCWDWGHGKFKDSEGVTVFEPAPEQLSLDSFVRARLVSLAQSTEELESIRNGWPADNLGTVLGVHVGPMASGAAVLADRDHALMIQKQHRKVIGIDMEAYSVFAAAEQSKRPRPIPFVIKGVVDFADPLKGDSHQAYASYVSASLLKLLMERH